MELFCKIATSMAMVFVVACLVESAWTEKKVWGKILVYPLLVGMSYCSIAILRLFWFGQ
jgi:hypothetical protein